MLRIDVINETVCWKKHWRTFISSSEVYVVFDLCLCLTLKPLNWCFFYFITLANSGFWNHRYSWQPSASDMQSDMIDHHLLSYWLVILRLSIYVPPQNYYCFYILMHTCISKQSSQLSHLRQSNNQFLLLKNYFMAKSTIMLSDTYVHMPVM